MPRKQVSDEIKQETLRKHLDEGRTVKSLCDEYFLAHSTIGAIETSKRVTGTR